MFILPISLTILFATAAAALNVDEEGAWSLWITGAERTTVSLSDDLLIVLYGDGGKSDELTLAGGQLCDDQLVSDQFVVGEVTVCWRRRTCISFKDCIALK